MNDFTHHLKNPPKKIFAYMHSAPGNSLMGVAISAISGKILEAVILPTKQRVMLGLGIGNDTAQAHATYRRHGGRHGYQLIWIEDPEEDPRMNPLKMKKLQERQGQAPQENEAKPQENEAPRPIEKTIEIDLESELTAQLIKKDFF